MVDSVNIEFYSLLQIYIWMCLCLLKLCWDQDVLNKWNTESNIKLLLFFLPLPKVDNLLFTFYFLTCVTHRICFFLLFVCFGGVFWGKPHFREIPTSLKTPFLTAEFTWVLSCLWFNETETKTWTWSLNNVAIPPCNKTYLWRLCVPK